MQIFLKSIHENYTVTLLEISEEDFIKEIIERLATKIIEKNVFPKKVVNNLKNNLQRIKIIFAGKVLEDGKTIGFYDIQKEGTVNFLIMPLQSSKLEVSAKEKAAKILRKKLTNSELKFLKKQTFTTKEWEKILESALKK